MAHEISSYGRATNDTGNTQSHRWLPRHCFFLLAHYCGDFVCLHYCGVFHSVIDRPFYVYGCWSGGPGSSVSCRAPLPFGNVAQPHSKQREQSLLARQWKDFASGLYAYSFLYSGALYRSRLSYESDSYKTFVCARCQPRRVHLPHSRIMETKSHGLAHRLFDFLAHAQKHISFHICASKVPSAVHTVRAYSGSAENWWMHTYVCVWSGHSCSRSCGV